MLKLYVRAKDALRRFERAESGQDTFEYLLIVGGISVAVIAAVAVTAGTGGTTAIGGLIGDVLQAVRNAINTVITLPG